MKENDNNPLGLKDKLYTIEEFGAELRNKFGGDNYISNVMIAEIFLAKYPVYSCKIKNPYLTKKLRLLLEFKLIKP
jgi:hypothetical protein